MEGAPAAEAKTVIGSKASKVVKERARILVALE